MNACNCRSCFCAAVTILSICIFDRNSGASKKPSEEEKIAVKAIKAFPLNNIEFDRNGRVRSLQLMGMKTEDLRKLKPLSQLEQLTCRDSDITDAGLKSIGHLQSLRYLDIDRSQISDDGLKRLDSLKNLETLIITRTPIGSAGMKYLKGLKHLHSLNLSGTKVDDKGLAQLKSIPGLRDLSLGVTFQSQSMPFLTGEAAGRGRNRKLIKSIQITDSSLVHLQSLAHLESINLRGTAITDAGLKHLSTIKSLKTLNLIETRITDKGLVHLESLMKLRSLMLVEEIPVLIGPGPFTKTTISDRAVARLQRVLPKCVIRYYKPDFLFGIASDSKGDDWFYVQTGPYALDSKSVKCPKQGRGLKLDFSKRRFSNFGIARLQKLLPDLEELNLRGTRVTNGAIDRLATFSRLKSIDLRDTAVTAAGAAKLKNALPNCTILVRR